MNIDDPPRGIFLSVQRRLLAQYRLREKEAALREAAVALELYAETEPHGSGPASLALDAVHRAMGV